MLVLKKGENARVETIVNEGSTIAECHLASKHPSLKDSDARYQQQWVIDFANCTQEQIIALAAETIKIRIRRTFVNDSNPNAENWTDVQFDASEFITERKSKVTRTLDTIEKMTDDEKAALLAALNAS
jgi:hypothetical protein